MIKFKTHYNLLILGLVLLCGSSSLIVGQAHSISVSSPESLIQADPTFLELLNSACSRTTKNLLISGLAFFVGLKDDQAGGYAVCERTAILTLYGAHYLFSKSLDDTLINISLGVANTFIFKELLSAYDQEARVRGCLLWFLLVGSNIPDSETFSKAITKVIAVLGHKKKTKT